MIKNIKIHQIFHILIFLFLSLTFCGCLSQKSNPVKSITKNDLLNGEYLVDGIKINLKDGYFYSDCNDDIPESELTSKISLMAIGDLNSDGIEDAAVILWYNGGGSGVFFRLVAILNEDEHLRQVDCFPLGDRVVINSLKIDSEKIIIDIIVHDKNDGLCCPSVREVQKYKFDKKLHRIKL